MTRMPAPSLVRSEAPSGGRALHDPFGRLYGDAFGPPRDPLLHAANPNVVHRDIPITALTGEWNINAIRGALASHKVGQFAGSSLLVDDTFGDDRVQATLGSRTGALFGQTPIHTQSAHDDGGECFKAWVDQWENISSQAILTNIKRWAIMIGFCVSEILWDTSVTPWRCVLKPWHPQFIYYRWDIRRLVASTIDGPEIIEPGDGKWFVHAPFGIYRGWIHASIRSIAEKWMIKQLSWRDWARFNERHGLPIIKAYVPAAGDAVQKQNFVAAMSTLGQEAVVGLPQNIDETGYDLELLEARDRGYDTFGKNIEACDRAIILAIKSQNLTTEVTEGSFAAARQHGGTEQVTLEFDNSTFAYDLYNQVARPFALYNFGDAEKAVHSSWDVSPIEDRAAEAKSILDASTALVALKGQGIPVDVVQYARKFKIPIDPKFVTQDKGGTIFAYHIAGGIVTKNEVRATLKLPPIDGGDELTEPANEAPKDSTE